MLLQLTLRLLTTLNIRKVGLCLNDSLDDKILYEANDFGTALMEQGNSLGFGRQEEVTIGRNGILHNILLLCDLPTNVSLNYKIFLPNYHWLSPEASNVLSSMSLLPLRFDSKVFTYKADNNPVLHEWYMLKGKILYSLEHDLEDKPSLPYIWERRGDLKGAELINGLVPMRYKNPVNMQLEDGSFVGFMVDVLNMAKVRLNFSTSDVLVPDNDFGVMKDDCSWTGVVGQLQEGNYDVSFTGLTVTPSRQTVIDFSLGVFEDVTTLTIRNPDLFGKEIPLDVTAFLTIFTKLVWFLLIVHVGACGLYFMLKSSYIKPNTSPSLKHGFLQGTKIHLVTLLQLGSSSHFRNMSERMAYLSISMLSIMIFVSYTGDLTAFMTVGTTENEIKSFEVSIPCTYILFQLNNLCYVKNQDVLNMGMSVATLRGTNHQAFLFDTSGNEAKDKVTKVLVDTLPELEEAVFFKGMATYYSLLTIEEKYPYVIAITDFENSLTMHYGIGLQKDSELFGLFNYNIIKMKQGGQYLNCFLKLNISDLFGFTYHRDASSSPSPLGQGKKA